MDKELKIAVTIFLIFFVFGLASFINQGSFASPVFLNQFVFLFCAVLFLAFNVNKLDSILLWIYLIPVTLSFLIDHFTMGYLAEKFQNNGLLELTQTDTFSIVFLFGYFGSFLYFSVRTFSLHKRIIILLAQLILLLSTPVLMIFTTFSIDQDMSFHLFLILSIFIINRFNTANSKGFAVLSYQFLLLLLLEGLEYFL